MAWICEVCLHASTDKLSKGDKQHCTLILGGEKKSRSTSQGLVIRCAARCPLSVHSTAHIALHIQPSATSRVVLLQPSFAPFYIPGNTSSATGLTPPQQSGCKSAACAMDKREATGVGDTKRSNNLWNRFNAATPPVMIKPTVTNIGTNRISRDFSAGRRWEKLVPLPLCFPRAL